MAAMMLEVVIMATVLDPWLILSKLAVTQPTRIMVIPVEAFPPVNISWMTGPTWAALSMEPKAPPAEVMRMMMPALMRAGAMMNEYFSIQSQEIAIRKRWSAKFKKILWEGAGEREFNYVWKGKRSTYKFRSTWDGILYRLEKRYRETTSEKRRQQLEKRMAIQPCADCEGLRLRPESLATR